MRHTLILVATVAAVAAMSGFGCDSPFPGMRFAPGEEQKATRDVAHRIARAVQQHGLPPGTPAGEALADTALEASLEAGRPLNPIPLDRLIPPGTAQAWSVRQEQVAGLRTKTRVLLQTVTGQVEQVGDVAEDLRSATGLLSASVIAQRLEMIARNAGVQLDVASAIPVPDDPQVSEAEDEAARQVAYTVRQISAAAATAGSARPTVSDVADTALGEAEFWYEQLAPVLIALGVPGVAGIGVAIKRGRDVVKARTEYEANRRSGAQIVHQAQAFMDSPLGQTTVQIGKQETTVADVLKGFLSGQDAQTRAFVAEAKEG